MRTLLSPVLLLALLLAGALVSPALSNPERERDRGRALDLDSMDHFHHHEDLMGMESDHHLPPHAVCEPIKIAMCMGIGYNQTKMPNLVGHETQTDADALLQTFSPLIQYGCSPHLKLFLCSAHVPMCSDKVPQPIGPCRSLCESVKSNCEPVLKEFGFQWPPSLECNKFHPENNHQHMCNPGPIDNLYGHNPPVLPGRGGSSLPFPPPPYYSGGSPTSGGVMPTGDHSSSQPHLPFVPPHYKNPTSISGVIPGINHPIIKPTANGNSNNSPYPFGGSHIIPNSPISNNNHNNHEQIDYANGHHHGEMNKCKGFRKIWTRGSCWIKCSAGLVDDSDSGASTEGFTSLFHPSEKLFARNYALPWAILSLSAALIALTLSACSPRFSVAERPIIYLAVCQVLFSIGVIIGSTSTVSCVFDKATGLNLLAAGGMVPSSCAVVFLLTYFFGTAANMWWVILCLSWLLSLNRNMASSLQQKEWSLFHLASWGIASALTSTALVHKKVDADELTGICGVGFQDMEALTYYNLIPLSICVVLGYVFIIGGLIARIFFPEWNLPLSGFRLWKPSSTSSGQSRLAGGCELSNNSGATTTVSHNNQGGGGPAAVGHPHHHQHLHHHLGNGGLGSGHLTTQNNFRGPHGYSPVLVLPSHPNGNGHSHSYHHGQCNGVLNPNNNNDGSHHQYPGGHSYFPGCTNPELEPFYTTGNSPASVLGVAVSGGVGSGGGGGLGGGVGGSGGGLQIQRLTKSLENSKAVWMRIGIFALVHSFPIAVQMGTMIYELSKREDWESGRERPNLQIFLLRLNMNLIAGLTIGVWVLLTYSCKSLSAFIRRHCFCFQLPTSGGPTSKKNKSPHHLTHNGNHHHHHHVQGQKSSVVPSSYLAPLLPDNSNGNSSSIIPNSLPPPMIPVPAGSSSSSSNNHNSTLPILGSNNTFTTRGALAVHNGVGMMMPGGRSHNGGSSSIHSHPLPPSLPARNPPEHFSSHQHQHHHQRIDSWRRGETIV